jgi:uncharacterized protein
MATFIISTINPANGRVVKFRYDSSRSSLVDVDSGVSVVPVSAGISNIPDSAQEPCGTPGGMPAKVSPSVLKISLGLSCNYSCSYCSQRFVPHADATSPVDVNRFLAQLNTTLTEPPQRIEFWGGEPFVYWKTLKPLAEGLRQRYRSSHFNIITNGSLLDPEKSEWLDRLGFSVGLSHDGPGYHARGLDPLDDPAKQAGIMDLYGRLHPQGRISINAMIHAGNPSRAAVQTWLQERFGQDVPIGEGAFIDPYDEGGLASSLQSPADHIAFRQRAFAELRAGLASNFAVASSKIIGFVDSIKQARPAAALGQKCAMDRPDHLAVDLHGNVLTCQNVSAAAIAPNGQPHKVGHLANLSLVSMRTASHWSQRDECTQCPVLQLCQGSCMFLQGPLWEAACDNAYSDNVVFLAAAIEFLTGCIPFYIDGEFHPDRKDIFGQLQSEAATAGNPVFHPRRVIPILCAPTKTDQPALDV